MTTTAFLDANVLAKPFTRTLLLVGSGVSDARFVPVWSTYAEGEAERALARRFGPSAMSLSTLRDTWGFRLTPTGTGATRFAATSESDRQILADAERAGAAVLVTEDVDDFAVADLESAGVTAVHYDLFAARFLTAAGYRAALEVIARGTGFEQVHAAAGRLHPRVFNAFADEFPGIDPMPYAGEPPRQTIRGPGLSPTNPTRAAEAPLAVRRPRPGLTPRRGGQTGGRRV